VVNAVNEEAEINCKHAVVAIYAAICTVSPAARGNSTFVSSPLSLEAISLLALLRGIGFCLLHRLQDLFGGPLLRLGRYGVGPILLVGQILCNPAFPTAHVPVPYETGVVENLRTAVCYMTRKEEVISRLDAPCYDDAKHKPHE